MQAAVIQGENNGLKKDDNGTSAVVACCNWLLGQHNDNSAVGVHRNDSLLSELAVLEADLSMIDPETHAADYASKLAEIAAKRTEMSDAQQNAIWRPRLEVYEVRRQLCGLNPEKQNGSRGTRTQQPLLWRDLALLLMLQSTALEYALKCANRHEGVAAASRSPSTSPFKQATPSLGKPIRVHAGISASQLLRGSNTCPSPALSQMDDATSDSSSTPKAFIPEESSQQQLQHWQTALCRLPYVEDGANGKGGHAVLVPLMQLLKVQPPALVFFDQTESQLNVPVVLWIHLHVFEFFWNMLSTM
jgi:hypothetical protein